MTKYAVDFYFPHSVVTVHTEAENEEAARETARVAFCNDLGYSELSSILYNAQDVLVEPMEWI